jgi:NitT/TauT family transport system ATP-binding protein
MLSLVVRRKAFDDAQGRAGPAVLQNIELTVRSGEFLCILGPSGCGKTTLLNIIAGLDRDFDGELTIARPGNSEASNSGSLNIGYVFQIPTLLPWRTVLENLRIVMNRDQIARNLAETLLDAMGLIEYRDAYPGTLSLGMSRRVALARAFAVEPDVLLMDEPFVSLDEDTAANLQDLLLELWNARNPTIIFVTHDSRESIRLAQRIIILSRGPSRILTDQPIQLSQAQRNDPAAVEAVRERLLAMRRSPT